LGKLNLIKISGFGFELEPVFAAAQLPQKMMLDSKVVKNVTKIIILLY
jgi:hypothetical protein